VTFSPHDTSDRRGAGRQYDSAMSWYGGGQPLVQISFAGLQWSSAANPGVNLISGIDSNFNADEFLSFAEGVFLRVAAARSSGHLEEVRPLVTPVMWSKLNATSAKRWRPIAQVEHASVVTAQHDNDWDTVTVRFAARAADRKRHEVVEDWTFQRQAASGAVEMPHECPSCGAPTGKLRDDGSCGYCNVPIAGARGGWKLVRITEPTQQASATGRSASGWIWFVVIMILVTTVLPIVLIAGVFAKVGSDVGDAFSFPTPPTSSVPPPGISIPPISIPAIPGSLDGDASLSGAISGANIAPTNLSLIGGEAGACTDRAGKATGLRFVSAGPDPTDGQNKILNVTATLPPGTSGTGTYDLASVPLTVDVTFAVSGANSRAQTFKVGTGSGATLTLGASASGTLTFSNLVPQTQIPGNNSLNQPLSGSVSFTCG
jgi:hypothetical protein